MERKICKSMTELTGINRKRQMSMSHRNQPFAFSLSHWHILQQQRQQWPLDMNHFNNSLLMWSSSPVKALWRIETHDITPQQCCSPPGSLAGGSSWLWGSLSEVRFGAHQDSHTCSPRWVLWDWPCSIQESPAKKTVWAKISKKCMKFLSAPP